MHVEHFLSLLRTSKITSLFFFLRLLLQNSFSLLVKIKLSIIVPFITSFAFWGMTALRISWLIHFLQNETYIAKQLKLLFSILFITPTCLSCLCHTIASMVLLLFFFLSFGLSTVSIRFQTHDYCITYNNPSLSLSLYIRSFCVNFTQLSFKQGLVIKPTLGQLALSGIGILELKSDDTDLS